MLAQIIIKEIKCTIKGSLQDVCHGNLYLDNKWEIHFIKEFIYTDVHLKSFTEGGLTLLDVKQIFGAIFERVKFHVPLTLQSKKARKKRKYHLNSGPQAFTNVKLTFYSVF